VAKSGSAAVSALTQGWRKALERVSGIEPPSQAAAENHRFRTADTVTNQYRGMTGDAHHGVVSERSHCFNNAAKQRVAERGQAAIGRPVTGGQCQNLWRRGKRKTVGQNAT